MKRMTCTGCNWTMTAHEAKRRGIHEGYKAAHVHPSNAKACPGSWEIRDDGLPDPGDLAEIEIKEKKS